MISKLALGYVAIAILALSPTAATAQNKGYVEPREGIYLGELPLLGEHSLEASKCIATGNRAVDEGRIEDAIASFEASQKLCPLPAAVLGLARCAALRGDYETALQKYSIIIKDPLKFRDLSILTEYALCLSETGRRKPALAVYERLVASCARGYALYKTEIALPEFRSDYPKRRFDAMLHVIAALNSRHRTRKGVAQIEQAAALAPESATVYFYKGVILGEIDTQAAAAAFKKARRLDTGGNGDVIDRWLIGTQTP